MMSLFVVLVFFLGAAIGSFLNVLVDRYPKYKDIVSGRSKCDKCHKILTPFDLIPVISFAMLLGRCRYCHTKLPKRLFISEVICGILFASIFVYGLSSSFSGVQFILIFIIAFALSGIFLMDMMHGIIPDEFTGITIISALLMILVSSPNLLVEHLITAIGCLVLFLILFVITRGRGMGFGDVKFSFALGLFLGFPSAIIGLYSAFLTAAVISIILVIKGRKKLHGGTIVFGPFLVGGTLFAYFFGDKIFRLFF